MMAAMRARLPLAACLAALLCCCGGVEPNLYPFDPPPNIPDSQELIQIPEEVVTAIADAQTIQLREDALAAVAEGRRVLSIPGALEAIRSHRILTGMTVEEVVWSIGAPPTRVRDQGPPGGHTLMWQPPSLLARDRVWVRFDEWGKAAAAGTH